MVRDDCLHNMSPPAPSQGGAVLADGVAAGAGAVASKLRSFLARPGALRAPAGAPGTAEIPPPPLGTCGAKGSLAELRLFFSYPGALQKALKVLGEGQSQLAAVCVSGRKSSGEGQSAQCGVLWFRLNVATDGVPKCPARRDQWCSDRVHRPV
jgi:hypothetical protein